MRVNRRVYQAVMTILVLSAAGLAAQAPQAPSRQAEKNQAARPNPAAISDESVAATREELFKILRVSPKLTTVVARDPSLLSEQDYVARNNPTLAEFLASHPEIARNPEYYLFGTFETAGRYGRPQGLERAVWPEFSPRDYSPLTREIVPFLIFVTVLSALLWLFRVLLENRRWSRIFKLQTEVHSRLLDKFSANEELLTYMQSEAGRRFLEAAPIPAAIGQAPQMSGHLARVLTPLQLGVVLAMVGAGLLYLRNSIQEIASALLVFGTLALMLGLGFIIAAAISWGLASHFGLLAQGPSAKSGIRSMQETKGQP